MTGGRQIARRLIRWPSAPAACQRRCCMGGLQRLQPPIEVARLDRPNICVDNHPDLGSLGRRDDAFDNRRVIAAIAAVISAGSMIGGKSSCTGRARRGAMIRSKQSRIAVGSPSRANSIALRVSASTPPSSNVSAVREAWFRHPRGLPAGLPDCPLTNGPPGCARPEFAGRIQVSANFL